MKKIFISILSLCFLMIFSCKKFLDTKPTSFGSPVNYYNTKSELQTALNSVYDILTNGESLYGAYGTDMALKFGFNSDEGTALTPYQEMLYNYDAGSSAVRAIWNSLYSGIARANLLLDNVDNTSIDITDGDRSIIKAQALFLRGYYYFLLVSQYGDVPLVLEPTSSTSGDLGVAAATSKDVYTQLLSDMTTAESLLDKNAFTESSLGYTEKVTVDAVRAILARVCLFMASPGYNGSAIDATKYKDANSWADKVINSADHSLNTDYRQIFKNLLQDKYDTKESIWEAGLYGTTSAEGSSFVFYTAIKNSPGGAQGTTYITRKLNDSYAAWDSVRKEWNCADYYYSSAPKTFDEATTKKVNMTDPWYYFPGKWRRIYENTFAGAGGTGQSSYNSCNFPIIRLADVYLMKAEAENAVNGPTTAAYNAINMVRRRAFKASLTQTNTICDLPKGLSQSQFLDSVKIERYKELCFEGIRKWDLIRWGDFVKTMQSLSTYAAKTIGNTPSGLTTNTVSTIAARVTDKFNYLPIPSYELQVNNKLAQNALWK